MSDKSPDRIIAYDPSPDDDSVLQQDQPYPAVDPVARLAVEVYSIQAARGSKLLRYEDRDTRSRNRSSI